MLQASSWVLIGRITINATYLSRMVVLRDTHYYYKPDICEGNSSPSNHHEHNLRSLCDVIRHSSSLLYSHWKVNWCNEYTLSKIIQENSDYCRCYFATPIIFWLIQPPICHSQLFYRSWRYLKNFSRCYLSSFHLCILRLLLDLASRCDTRPRQV